MKISGRVKFYGGSVFTEGVIEEINKTLGEKQGKRPCQIPSWLR
jgi:hypothetical protein